MAMIYKRGKVFWIRYYRNGKYFRESSHSEKRADAVRIAKMREGDLVRGKNLNLKAERTTFDEIAKDYIADYAMNAKKSKWRAEILVSRLSKYFEGYRAVYITSEAITQYIISRQEQGINNSTINRELTALRRMFNLALRQTPPKVLSAPHIVKLKEGPARKGFFEFVDFMKMKEALPDHLKPVLIMAYFTGLRRGEILSLKWSNVNLFEKTITLEAGTTKNGESRTIFMTGELYHAILDQKKQHETIYPESDFVFSNRDGSQIKNFRKSWNTACREIGIARLFHDLRRTFVRNAVRAGIPEAVVMRLSGHKTRSIFDRYNVIDQRDLESASKKVNELYQENVEAISQAEIGKVVKMNDNL